MSQLLGELPHLVGSALLHFVWQGALVALCLGVTLRMLAASKPEARSAVATLALVAMLLSPVATVVFLLGADEPLQAAPIASAVSPTRSPVLTATQLPTVGAAVRGLGAALDGMMSLVCALWLIGVLALSTLHVWGWQHSSRWKQSGVLPVHPALRELADRAASRLGLSQVPPILQSVHIDVPMVLGWLKPVVLMPASVVTGLPPRLLECLLAHELEHVRRLDNLVNMFQILAETLFFYHPAVWWVSKRIRIEREHCCDDAAAAIAGGPLDVIRALATLEQTRHPHPAPALAADGGMLLERIRRLAAPKGPVSRASAGLGMTSVALWLILLGLGSSMAFSAIRSGTADDATVSSGPRIIGETTEAGTDADVGGSSELLIAGTWSLSVEDGELRLELIRDGGFRRVVVRVTVTEDQFGGLREGDDVTFTWPRPAGTFELRGHVAGRTGHGTFTLTPSADLIRTATAHGFSELTAGSVYELAATVSDLADLPLLMREGALPGFADPPADHPFTRLFRRGFSRLLPPFIKAPMRAILRARPDLPAPVVSIDSPPAPPQGPMPPRPAAEKESP